jgi:conjugal transfer ATP-binding protein TraC
VGDVVHGNSAFKFYLESDQFDKAKEAKVIPYEGFALDYLSSLKSNKPNYSEVFMDTPFGLGIVRLSVDPFTYYQNSSSGPEIAEIDALVDGGLSYEAAIRVMIKKYRSAA